MMQLFNQVALAVGETTTKTYSTSFSIGVRCLRKDLRWAIYSIYGFVRFADEIVDTFHGYDKEELLQEFKAETWKAIRRKISLNPILHGFQQVVHRYGLEDELIGKFLRSMEMDLSKQEYDSQEYAEYIVGSAEVVGLMCLRVFTDNDTKAYDDLKGPARKLGAAFQKVNFLRDIANDHDNLGRVYFPGVDFKKFTEAEKANIEADVAQDFRDALVGIRKLSPGVRLGVYVAFIYYNALFAKIKRLSPTTIQIERIRISNLRKIMLLLSSFFRHRFLTY
jgi:15-cis-phytoene synthase